MADLPTGAVTFLFTDIEGSTPLWEREPDQMRLALARHDAILGTTIAYHGGHAYKTIGDAFQAAFALPAQAVAAALAAQRAFATQPWETSDPVRVRMGLHIGIAMAEGNDYRTTHTLNRVARIMAAGHGGQILLSREVADLVRRDLPPDVTLRDMGTQRMKGLTHLEHLFQLVAPDLPAAFPPLKTLDHHPNNLPLQPTLLIGRENEIASVCALLRRADIRLVTLTGPGGAGKTRLALQTAAELVDEFSDGVWFVNLAPMSDPDLVATTIAQTLGVRETGSRPLRDSLQDYLREKQLLLLLDNFEQVVEAAPLVAELLATASGLNVLVTSRAALHLSGEHEFAVPPLALPDRTQLPALERLTQYEAVRLFIARAQAVQADFVVTNANAPAVAEICHQLDGLPLAIELAAARIKLFPPQALLARLGNRLKLLTGGARDLPQRQQTIRATIDWSYQLLDAGEQVLFARLGVFVGGFMLEAAEAVANADGELSLDVVDGTAALLDHSLLRQAEGSDGEPRFTMLETIHEYALERLAASGEEDAIRRRHADYFLVLAETAEQHLSGQNQMVWINRLEQEHDNLRAVFAWSRTVQDDAAIGLRLAGALSWFWIIHSHFSQGRMWLEAILDRPNGAVPAARAKALRAAGMVVENQGEFARAIALQEESLALYRELEDTVGIAETLMYLGRCKVWQGAYAQARSLLGESLALFQAQENTPMIMWALMSLGDMAFNNAEVTQAQGYFHETLALCSNLGDMFGSAWALTNLGRVAHALGDDRQAQAYYTQTLAAFRQLGHRRDVATVCLELGRVARSQGDAAQAYLYYAESLTVFVELMDKQSIPQCLEGIAGLANAAGQPAHAARLFGAAEALCESAGVPLPPVMRAEYDLDVAATRAQLDEPTFATAWDARRALTLEQAIAYALEPPPAVTPPAPPVTPPPIPSISAYPAGLTEREVAVLRLLAQGLSYAEIATQLVISPRTVNRHLTAIYSKLDVTSRHAASRFATDQHLV